MKKRSWLFVVRCSSLAVLAALLSSCSLPPTAYYNRGDPENLLDVSTEVVNVGLASNNSLAQLSDVIKQDPPTRAQLGCSQSDALCIEAKTLLEQHGIVTGWAAGNTGHDVTLIYERVVARDCQNRYIDDSQNEANLPPPTFGCSLMGNTVQQVSDKRQFVAPNLLDFRDADKAAQNYDGYRSQPAPQPAAPAAPPPNAVYPGAVAPEVQ